MDGEDIQRLPLRLLQDIRGKLLSYIFHDPLATLNPVLTIGEQLIQVIRRHQSLSSGECYAEALSLLSKVRIPSPETRIKAYPHQFSGEMRQRVCIASALANRPEVLIVDEPTTALDVIIQAEILSLLNDLRQPTLEDSKKGQKTGLSVLFITHGLEVVSIICEKVAVM